MSINYSAVQWNRQKRIYDTILLASVACFLVSFLGLTKLYAPSMTDEILLLRAFGAAAFLLLHVILCIGPLCRLNSKFLPLLYNRRHAGVTMAALGSIHAILAIAVYHAGGNMSPMLSLLIGNPIVPSVAGIPFQIFGLIALIILLLMAATSHDFWLVNLSAPTWKALHMMVYLAYASLILHVGFGILQAEHSPVLSLLVASGLAVVTGLHIAAALRELPHDRERAGAEFVDACAIAEIPENRARTLCVAGERVAIFRYDGKLAAVSSVCQHQNGPLGEGKILDGCITCPWHGYQYDPETGASPPPFTECVPTFQLRVQGERVLVSCRPNAPGQSAGSVRVPS